MNAKLNVLVLVLGTLHGCRFGGGSGLAGSPIVAGDDAASGAARTEPDGGKQNAAGAQSPPPAVDASDADVIDARTPGTTDASSTPSTPDAVAPSPDASAPARDASDPGAGPGCRRPQVSECDPVANRGCAPPMQCVIDFTAPGAAPAGYCAFSTPIDGGPFCVATPVTESCPPSSTCVDGVCRALCFCDEDCSQGECCGERIGELPFKLCGPC